VLISPKRLALCSVFVLIATLLRGGLGMPDIEFVRGEIVRLRLQVLLQRREIAQLQRAGIPSTSAEALLDRMLNKIDNLCAQRDRLKQQSKALRGRRW
jgi:hypothetical protein